MKRILAFVLIFILTVGTIAIPARADENEAVDVMKKFYVSPTGDDKNAGTENEPLKTLDGARLAVRKINKSMTGDIVVCFKEGVYEIDETVNFDVNDSGTNGHYVRYEAEDGAKVVISGGKRVTGKWKNEGGGIYSVDYERDKKLRSLYVNGKRAYMTSGKAKGQGGYGTYSVTKNQADWAWISGSASRGVKFNKGDIPLDTRNSDDIELMTQTTWNTAIVCVEELVDIGNGKISANLQMPYGAIAQKPSWGNSYQLSKNAAVYNVFEWLDEPGEFYFDKSANKLYYYPREDENMETAEVVVPCTETLVSIQGIDTEKRAENIVFEGITFSDTDWLMYKVADSYGRATVQGAAGIVRYADGNWHYSIYRAYDVGPGAIMAENARNLKFLNNTVENTGNDGLSMVNDVTDTLLDGNIFYDTGGSAILIGHPQHSYIGDKNSGKGTYSDREKYDVGVEGACKRITVTNNLLYEAARLFWGDAALMVFHAEEFVMKYNHIEETPYNGLSLGWGWCNMNGDSSSIVPGEASVTTKNNTIESNTFINTMETLGDAGAIYTLGDMSGTVIKGNFINHVGNRNPSVHLIRAIHPDEGSAHIYGRDNVMLDIPDNMAIIDCKSWGKKHDNTWEHNYSTSDRYSSSGTNYESETKMLDKQVREDGVWGNDVFLIATMSGIRGEYLKRLPEVYKIQDRLLGTDYFIGSGKELDLKISDGDIDGEVWLAKEGEAEFCESESASKMKNGKIKVPNADGVYRLFVVKGETVSEPSEGSIAVYGKELLLNAENGGKYRVSFENPLKLEFEDKYVTKICLNGEEIQNGYEITIDGKQKVEITDLSDETRTVEFETYTNEADRVFVRNFAAKDGYVPINATDKEAWFVPTDYAFGNLIESDDMTKAASGERFVKVPKKVGEYKLVLCEGNEISELSDATLSVNDGNMSVTEGLVLKMSADSISGEIGDKVGAWADEISGYKAVQEAEEMKPSVSEDEFGMRYVSFDGINDGLELRGDQSLDLNGKSNLSIVVQSAYTGTDPSTGSNGDTSAAIFFPQTSSWGAILVSPCKRFVVTRFGSGQSNNVVKFNRENETDEFTTIVSVKDGSTEKVYDNGRLAITQTNKYEKTANTKTSFGIGITRASSTTYFTGGIAEILIYDRTLDENEVTDIQACMNGKRYINALNESARLGEDVLASGIDNCDKQSAERFLDAYGDVLWLRSDALSGEDVNGESVKEKCAYMKDCVSYLSDVSLVAKNDADSIALPKNATEDIELPKQGVLGSDIMWHSDMENVLTSEGKVTRPESGEAICLVKLTAKVTYGGFEEERTFVVKVLPKVEENDVWMSTADYSYRTFTELESGAVCFNMKAKEFTDAFVGIGGSDVNLSAWGNYSIVFRMKPSGYMDAVNGGNFEYEDRVEYEPGEIYHVRIVIDGVNKRFSAYVTDSDNVTYTVAKNYSFRTSAPDVKKLSKITVRGGSGIAAESFCIESFCAEAGTTGEIINLTKTSEGAYYCFLSDVEQKCVNYVAYYDEDFVKTVKNVITFKADTGEILTLDCTESAKECKIIMCKDDFVTPTAQCKCVKNK